MRLHQLSMTAFGPFAGTAEVDFDTLASAGLFLLHGQTGAGKSSVLDAVCYALYGALPGSRGTGVSGGARLRSDHAADDRLTEVTLDFSVGGRRLRLTRGPEQRRPKRRGAGTTTEKAWTLLAERDSDCRWAARSNSHQEVGKEVEYLLGMSRDQFCQVVLLPQGDFARFLRADASQRQELLGKLFDTRRFQGVEQWLAQRRVEARRQADVAGREVEALVQRLLQAMGGDASETGQDAPAEVERPGGGSYESAELLSWAAALRCTAWEWWETAQVSTGRAQAQHETWGAEVRRVRALAERQRQYAVALRQRRELDARAPEFEELAEQETAARRAGTVLPLVRAGERAQQRRTAAVGEEARAREGVESQLDALRAFLPDGGGVSRPGEEPSTATDRVAEDSSETGSGGAVSPAGGDSGAADASGSASLVPDGRPATLDVDTRQLSAQSLRDTERAVEAELGRLEALLETERHAAELADERARLVRESAQAEYDLAEVDAWLADCPAKHEELTRCRDAARQVAASTSALEAEEAQLGRALDAAKLRDRLDTQVATAEREYRDAADSALRAKQAWLELRERRVEGMAAELAAQLTAGASCPVCGSSSHPAPAVTTAGQVTRSQEQEAERRFREAEGAEREADGVWARLRTEFAGARASAGEEPVAALHKARADVAERLEQARAEALAEEAWQERLFCLEQERATRTEARARDAELRTAHAARIESVDAQVESVAATVSAARGTDASVAARIARLRPGADACAAAAEATRGAEQAAEQVAEATAQAEQAARVAGFRDLVQVRQAAVNEAELGRLAERLSAWRDERAAVAAALSDPDLLAAVQEPAADVTGAEEESRRATELLRSASAAEHEAKRRVSDVVRLSGDLTERSQRLGPVLEEYALADRLASLTGGTSADNTLRMQLQSYVLAAQLERVAAAANVRLAGMSGGRYALVHSDEKAPGGRRSGLSLRAVDSWTGTERDTNTLSGGESFFCSLALALGLADVVTEEAGGMPLDTLFIDEGFGSLDEQTLDEVLDVLDGLRERDRAVGIVSHVPELRRRVPVQLRVAKTRSGSTVRLTGPESA